MNPGYAHAGWQGATDLIGRALIAFTLAFSATALITYLYHDYPPIGSWNLPGWLAMIGLPLIVLFVFFIPKNTRLLRSLCDDTTMST